MKKVKNMYFVNRPEHSNMHGLPKAKKYKSLKEKFSHQGYILNGYNATYKPTMFEVFEHDDVLEVEDMNSGIRFIVFRKGKK